MYLDYFDKFKGQEPYLHIDETEWSHIKETFEKDDVKESLAIVAMTYPMPTMRYPMMTFVRTMESSKEHGIMTF